MTDLLPYAISQSIILHETISLTPIPKDESLDYNDFIGPLDFYRVHNAANRPETAQSSPAYWTRLHRV